MSSSQPVSFRGPSTISGGSLQWNAVLALDQRHALLGPPGEPHPVGVAFFQDRDVEAGAVLAAHDGLPSDFSQPAEVSGGGEPGIGLGASAAHLRRAAAPSAGLRSAERRGDLLAVGKDPQPCALVVALAGLVVEDRQPAAVVADLVEAEIVPVPSGTSGLTSTVSSARGRRPIRPLMTRSQYVEWL